MAGVLRVLGAWAPKREARRRLLGVLGVLGAAGATSAAPHDPITTKVTFNREIRAILRARCATCHRPGGPAPMPLATYEDVRPWARALKDQALARKMPKWNAAHGYGTFTNDPSLTPAEMAVIAAWVDGGMPKGSGGPASSSVSPAASAFRRESTPLTIPASATDATLRIASRWIGGWSFEPGDPLITSVTLTSADGTAIGAWVAGDPPLELPAGAGIRVASPIRLHVQRRTAADYEKPFTAKRSTLRILTPATAPKRRVWVEETACGAPRTGKTAELLAVRPLLKDGGAARVWLERPGAARTIVGWFRNYEALYPRTYWLAHTAELLPESRVQADAPCTMQLTLASR